ncbi:hypothetical protein, partial [Bradyrhizobium sp. AUGA SZCCT0431]|uniref:hypothetical protein n=1 Tax=Bradyrhizobium sp. AUGA SZCCT0431 TaxID=2807674 RepID=UPI001BA55A51
ALCFVQTARETAGAARTRSSLRPLIGEGRKFPANLGRKASRECEAVFFVIASAAKQSIAPREERVDCFAALAMTVPYMLWNFGAAIAYWTSGLQRRNRA